jgi:hypothetical protein
MDLQQQTEPLVPPATPLWQAVPNAQALQFAINATLIPTIKSQEPSVAYSAQIIQACLIAISVCIQVLLVLSANQILCYLIPLINALLADQLFRIASLA